SRESHSVKTLLTLAWQISPNESYNRLLPTRTNRYNCERQQVISPQIVFGGAQDAPYLYANHAYRRTGRFADDEVGRNAVITIQRPLLPRFDLIAQGSHSSPRQVESRHFDCGEWRNSDLGYVDVI